MFNGTEEQIEYIKSLTWRVTSYGYVQNNKGEKLHRYLMGVTNPSIFVNHLGGDKLDNRIEKLSISDCLDNSKEKKLNSKNRTGMIGLLQRHDKYVGNIKIHGISIYSKYNTKDEAIIDLLIMQKHYGFRHNQELYYMIDNISEKRYKEVINNCERQLHSKRNDKIISQNKYELSEDGTFYWVYDDNLDKINNKFKISKEHLDKVLKGKWHIATSKDNNKIYVHGTIVIDGKRKDVKLHRYLLDLLDVKYKQWYVNHLDHDGLNNTIENIVITNAQGNSVNKTLEKGYYETPYGYRVILEAFKKRFKQTVSTEKEAIELVKQKREEFRKMRIEFKSREELDIYLNNK